MSNIAVTQEGGALRAEVVRSVRVSPHMQRVTLTGADLARLRWRGYDQWVRLFLPGADPGSLDRVPDRMSHGAYARMMAVPASRRPTVRSYTLRSWRPQAVELDIDFVIHGSSGVAAPWAAAATPGDPVVLIDQGCGWPSIHPGRVVLAADETGLPAVLGVLRDLDRSVRGVAFVEVLDLADAQEHQAPTGVDVHWLVRQPGVTVGSLVMAALGDARLPDGDRHGFAVGESRLATGVRRRLVKESGWDREEVTFCGYWKA